MFIFSYRNVSWLWNDVKVTIIESNIVRIVWYLFFYFLFFLKKSGPRSRVKSSLMDRHELLQRKWPIFNAGRLKYRWGVAKGRECVRVKRKRKKVSVQVLFSFFLLASWKLCGWWRVACWPCLVVWLDAFFGTVLRACVRVCAPGGLCCCLSFRVLILEDNECARFGTDRPSRPAYTGWGLFFPFYSTTKRLPFSELMSSPSLCYNGRRAQ